MKDQLFVYIRKLAETTNRNIDKKQVKYNEIVEVAIQFYSDPFEGVKELFDSCEKESSLYVKGFPMWLSLSTNYRWMLNN